MKKKLIPVVCLLLSFYVAVAPLNCSNSCLYESLLKVPFEALFFRDIL